MEAGENLTTKEMKTAEQFFEEQSITDANAAIDKCKTKFTRWDVFKFAELYAAAVNEPEITDEEIEKWIRNDANWAKTFINGAIYGAKAMRDGLIMRNKLRG